MRIERAMHFLCIKLLGKTLLLSMDYIYVYVYMCENGQMGNF